MRVRDSQSWHGCVMAGIGGLILFYLLAVPLLQYSIGQVRFHYGIDRFQPSSWLTLFNQRSIETLFALMCFSFGASIGSFLNVVAYRMPLNKSVVSQSSHCPGCGRPILPRDNVPVLGWLRLRGRCRNCHSPISIRYPVVEAICGTLFLILFVGELASGGANLPFRDRAMNRGLAWALMSTDWNLWGIYIYHCGWLVLMLTWALFAWDGNRIPKRAFAVALVLLSAPPLLFPELVIVPFDYFAKPLYLMKDKLLTTAATVICGAVAGVFWGYAFCQPLRKFMAGFQPEPGHRILVANVNISSLDQDYKKEPVELIYESESPNNSETHSLVEEGVIENLEQNVSLSSADEIEATTHEDESSAISSVPPELDDLTLDASFHGSILASTVCTGIVVGWQATIAIGLLIAFIRAVLIFSGSKTIWNSIPASAWILVASLIHLLFWRQIHGL